MKKQIFETSERAPICVAELLELATREVDPRDPQSLMAVAEPLYRLAQDRSLLQKYINAGLSNWRTGDFHFYSSQSCHLARLGEFVVRVNLWPLLPADPRRRAILADVLSYFDYHDHNFSFITANHFGPGYETELYSYERSDIIGYPGEKVNLECLGKHRLDDRTVMLYEEFKDVHSQLPPAEVSSSVNLMLLNSKSGLTNQHYFDPKSGRITAYVSSFSHKRVNALGFARYLYDEQTLGLLQEIMETHECSRTRVEAARVMVSIRGASVLPASSTAKMLRDPLAQSLWAATFVT